MQFNYQARDKKGEIQVGQVESSTKEAAANILQQHGLYITYLAEAKAPFYAKRLKFLDRVSRKDIVLFSRQLAILFQAKVPLVESLRVLAGQTKSLDFKEKILEMSEEVEAGTALSKTLSRYPKAFSFFYIAMVKAGELSGSLSKSLLYLADHLEKDYHLNSKVKGALVYPALIVFVVFIVLFIMVYFVIPQLAAVLTASSGELPAMTVFVIRFAAFFRSWAWLIILSLFLLFLIAIRYSQSEKGRSFFGEFFLRMPLIGPLLKMVYLSRFAENLSTLILGGLPIAQALETVADIISNPSYKKVVLEARDEVRKGQVISSVLIRYPNLFSPLFVQMTLVGEKTGTLDTSLLNVVSFYEQEIDRTINSLLSILEPALIVVLGFIVGGIILSILIPLYQMISI